jgi:hypothetical protein
MSRVTRNLANPVAPAARALAGLRHAITDRVKRWRGHPPEKAGVREPRRPKPTLPSAAIALAEPTVRVRRWFRLTGGHSADHT